MAVLRGIEAIARNLVLIRKKAADAVGASLEELGQKAVTDIRKRLSIPFQTYPTYIYETERLGRHGGPGKYPPGTIGTYSVKAASIRGSRAERVAALYPQGQHRLRDELTYKVNVDSLGRGVTLEVGYPPESITGTGKQAYIRHVLIGTEKMQSRNFISEFFRTARSPFFLAMRRAGHVIVRKA